ncbi:MAG: polyketide synthase dehydratase domain-containing protein, partial [Steroidobacteraceae bacterium]
RLSLPTYPFARERYWVQGERQEAPGVAVLHPLLQENASQLDEQRFRSRFSGDEFFLRDHVVDGAKVLPGVCYLEMARAAAAASEAEGAVRGMIRLRNVVWVAPLVVDEPRSVHIGLYREEQGGIGYEVYSSRCGEAGAEGGRGGGDEVIHGQGRAFFDDGGAAEHAERVDLARLMERCDWSVEASRCYEAFGAMGIEYGPAHRGIERLHVGKSEAGERYVLAELRLPEVVKETHARYVLHPSVLDSALQASIGMTLGPDGARPEGVGGRGAGRPRLPFALDEIEIRERSPAHAYAYVRASCRGVADEGTPEPAEAKKLDIDLCDEAGLICARLKGMATRALESGLTRAPAEPGQVDSKPRAAEDEPRAIELAMRWDPVEPDTRTRWPSSESKLLIVGGRPAEQQAIRARYPRSGSLVMASNDSIADLGERIRAQGEFEHVLWITPC